MNLPVIYRPALPMKYQPRVGDRVKNDLSLLNRNTVGTVIEADHRGIAVEYSPTRIAYLSLRHHLEVV